MKEIWRDIKDYEGLYQVSDKGNVKRVKHEVEVIKRDKLEKRTLNERLLEPWKSRKGYMKVALRKNNKTYEKFVHRLVAESFMPTQDKTLQVNHKDTNKENNTLENLEWCTCKYNIKHSYDNGLVDAKKRANSRKDNRVITFNGKTLTISQWAKELNINRSKIYRKLKLGLPIEQVLSA